MWWSGLTASRFISAAFAAKSMAPSRPVMPPRPLSGTTFRDRFVVTGMAILQVDLGQRTAARLVRTPATNSARPARIGAPWSVKHAPYCDVYEKPDQSGL